MYAKSSVNVTLIASSPVVKDPLILINVAVSPVVASKLKPVTAISSVVEYLTCKSPSFVLSNVASPPNTILSLLAPAVAIESAEIIPLPCIVS